MAHVHLRVLIAEDHAVTRTGIETVLTADESLIVVGAAADGDEALRLVEELQPDVLILDLVLPKRSGVSLLDAMAGQGWRPQVVVISGQGRGVDFFEAQQRGADGLLSKDDPPETIIQAIHAVASGERYVSPSVGSLLGLIDPQAAQAVQINALTPRELEILTLIAEGVPNSAIGPHLGISNATVKTHREHIRTKTGAANGVEMTRLAVRLGLVKA